MRSCPFVLSSTTLFEGITIGAMWLGTFILFVFFFLASTMVSKITIEDLRGDHFFSITASWGVREETLEIGFRNASGFDCHSRAFGFIYRFALVYWERFRWSVVLS